MEINDFSLFIFGIICGAAMMWVGSWYGRLYEWSTRRKLEKEVARMRRAMISQHVMCSAGIPGCSGGENCQWDHK